jgi:hypothetical protein
MFTRMVCNHNFPFVLKYIVVPPLDHNVLRASLNLETC